MNAFRDSIKPTLNVEKPDSERADLSTLDERSLAVCIQSSSQIGLIAENTGRNVILEILH